MSPLRTAAAAALLLTACASIANTPAQNLAYDRWATCDVPYSSLEKVDLDGRITFLATSSSVQEEIFRCLAEAQRTGQRLPDPVAVRPRGGP
jgi:outer membrane biogenesis lipoprotein LolB